MGGSFKCIVRNENEYLSGMFHCNDDVILRINDIWFKRNIFSGPSEKIKTDANRNTTKARP